MKRLLLCFTLVCACISAPRTASAWFGWVVFTVHADPLDPLGGTSTGWLGGISDDKSNGRPHFDLGPMDFWWQAHHWTEANAIGSTWIDTYLGVPDNAALLTWSLFGGTEEDYLWGNYLSHDFDFSLEGKSPCGPFNAGQVFSTYMSYVNPTATRFAANGQNYVASGSFYFTTEQPAPSQAPGIPEPSSLALLTFGVGALIAERRARK